MQILAHQTCPNLVPYIEEAIRVARIATCTDARCGAIIVQNGEIIGRGFNSPPRDLEGQRRCNGHKSDYDVRVTDKTCCIHAEQRAIMDALRTNSEKLPGSRLYFIRVDPSGNPKYAKWAPYCTICSKMTLDAGIAEFVLYREDGLAIYDTEEYNTISFGYRNED